MAWPCWRTQASTTGLPLGPLASPPRRDRLLHQVADARVPIDGRELERPDHLWRQVDQQLLSTIRELSLTWTRRTGWALTGIGTRALSRHTSTLSSGTATRYTTMFIAPAGLGITIDTSTLVC